VQRREVEFEDFSEDDAWSQGEEEDGEEGDDSTDDELDRLMLSVGIDDSGIGGSQGVYA
jgi:hypothetical protein